MGRPPLAIGTTGKITVTTQTVTVDGEPKRVYVARGRTRGFDGRTRQIERSATTANKARAALRSAAANNPRRGSGGITSEDRLSTVAKQYFADFEVQVGNGAKGVQTLRRYRQAWRVHIEPFMGELRLSEITPVHCDDLLKTVRASSTAGNAKIIRTVFSAIMKKAIKPYRAIETNPMSLADPVDPDPRRKVVALEPEQVPTLLDALRRDPLAVRSDLPEMCLWMICTGDRIGNMLTVDWSWLDLDDGTATIGAIAINNNGKMTSVSGSSKSPEKDIDLGEMLVTPLRERWLSHGCPQSGLVFPGRSGGLRNLRSLHHSMRGAFDRAGFTWLTPHGFRRTTASELDRAGVADSDIAAFLGHRSVATTRTHYLKRRQRSQRRRAALDSLVGGNTPGGSVSELRGAAGG